MMKVNIFFETISKAALYFRYYDENNYYVIKFNVKGQKKIELYKKVGGFESLMGYSIIFSDQRRVFPWTDMVPFLHCVP